MRKLIELLAALTAIFGTVIAFLVFLYGDNWLGRRSSDRPAERTAARVSETVGDGGNRVADPQPQQALKNAVSPPRASAPRPIIIELKEKSSPAPVLRSAQSVIASDDNYSKEIHRMNLSTVASRATLECRSAMFKQDAVIYRFMNEAVISQNQFRNTNNSRVMIADLQKWIPKVEKYLSDNKDLLPDINAFKIANANGNYGAFHREGVHAWATMDAKRAALEVIAHELEARPCDKIGKAAAAECEESGKCLAEQ